MHECEHDTDSESGYYFTCHADGAVRTFIHETMHKGAWKNDNGESQGRFTRPGRCPQHGWWHLLSVGATLANVNFPWPSLLSFLNAPSYSSVRVT